MSCGYATAHNLTATPTNHEKLSVAHLLGSQIVLGDHSDESLAVSESRSNVAVLSAPSGDVASVQPHAEAALLQVALQTLRKATTSASFFRSSRKFPSSFFAQTNKRVCLSHPRPRRLKLNLTTFDLDLSIDIIGVLCFHCSPHEEICVLHLLQKRDKLRLG